MIPTGRVKERLRLFYRVALDVGDEDAMWAVMEAERRALLSERRVASAAVDPAARAMVEAVCRHFRVELADLLGPSRMRRLVEARRVAMRSLSAARFSTPVIARHVGRAQSTVVVALGRVAGRADLVAVAERLQRQVSRRHEAGLLRVA